LIVLDASAALELLLMTETGERLVERIFAPTETLHAPELLDLEVAQVLRRYERGKALAASRAAEALDDLAALPLERYSHRLLLPRAWDLRANLTLYDAAYVALAELLDAPLLTCDAALARAPHAARVELLGTG
jgi:predicted nucleic acid-binding protein